MNILILPSWYPENTTDVYGSFFREQAIALSKEKNNIFVLNGTFTTWKNLTDEKCRSIQMQKDDGVVVYRRLIPSFGFSRNVRLCLYLYRRQIKQLINKLFEDNPCLKIDIIHAHSCYPAGFIACEIGKQLHVPVVITEHRSNYMQRELLVKQVNVLNKCIADAACFISVSEGLKKNIISVTGCKPEKILVIPNMYSSVFYRVKTLNANIENFRFISVGGLIKRKRHEQLIRCFNKAFSDNDNVSLLIIGEGPEREVLESRIKEGNLQTKIILAGRKSRLQVVDALRKSDAFVLCSSAETFGVVYVEALACGLPVIASRNGGAEDIINSNNGILVDVDNDEQLIEALKRMYLTARSYDAAFIESNVFDRFSENSVVANLQRVYSEVVNR